jgi:hypothetical protein
MYFWICVITLISKLCLIWENRAREHMGDVLEASVDLAYRKVQPVIISNSGTWDQSSRIFVSACAGSHLVTQVGALKHRKQELLHLIPLIATVPISRTNAYGQKTRRVLLFIFNLWIKKIGSVIYLFIRHYNCYAHESFLFLINTGDLHIYTWVTRRCTATNESILAPLSKGAESSYSTCDLGHLDCFPRQ